MLTVTRCCCCAFPERSGVKLAEGFICERCFSNPGLFFSGKRVLPSWTLAVKADCRVNNFSRNKSRDSVEYGYFTRRSKRFLAVSESLYVGQKQLFSFETGKLEVIE